MLKIIVGTKQKCIDWVNCISTDADYTDYWNPTDLTITKDLNRGEILGAVAEDLTYNLLDMPSKKATPQQCWLLFVVDATLNTIWSIDKIFYGGIITSTPKTFISNDANQISIKSSGFFWEFERINLDLPTIVNQYADTIIKKIILNHTDPNIVNIVSIEKPQTKIKLAKFSKKRTPFSALQSISSLYSDFELKITPTINSTFAGCNVTFAPKQKQYTPFLLNNDLLNKLGSDNTTIEDDITQVKNIFTLPFYTEINRDPETFIQITTEYPSELNSKCILAGQPIQADTIKILVDDFTSSYNVDLMENDLNNNNPPADHTASEGYIIRGSLNEVTGLHLLDASSSTPEWGDVALINNYENILYEPQNLTSIRIKELTINTVGDAIFCSYYDNSTKSSLITGVDSYTAFYVEDPTNFVTGDIIKIDNETASITNIESTKIYINHAINILETGKECYLNDFTLSRVIFGLFFKADGSLNVIENGQILPTTYHYETEDYTIRNHCVCIETFTTSQTTNNNTLEVKDSTGFSTNDIIELWINGNNNPSKQYSIVSIPDSTHIQINTQVLAQANIKVRTLPKARLQMNGGQFGEVSGTAWHTIATSKNTIQTGINQPKEIGFSPVLQKSLVGTIKEVNVKHYPAIEVISNENLLTISTIEDSAELDIHGFLINENNKYRIEVPEYKDIWPSGSKLIAKYKEKRIQELIDTNEQSMIQVAQRRGNPITSSDSKRIWALKGGLSANKEELQETVMSVNDARELMASIKELRSKEALQIKLDNLFSSEQIDTGQIIRLDLDDYSLKELTITRLNQKFLGLNNNLKAEWIYSLEANIVDEIDKLIKNSNKASKTIIDNDTESSVQEIMQYSQQETIFVNDKTYVAQSSVNGYILLNNQIADLRFLFTGAIL